MEQGHACVLRMVMKLAHWLLKRGILTKSSHSLYYIKLSRDVGNLDRI